MITRLMGEFTSAANNWVQFLASLQKLIYGQHYQHTLARKKNTKKEEETTWLQNKFTSR